MNILNLDSGWAIVLLALILFVVLAIKDWFNFSFFQKAAVTLLVLLLCAGGIAVEVQLDTARTKTPIDEELIRVITELREARTAHKVNMLTKIENRGTVTVLKRSDYGVTYTGTNDVYLIRWRNRI